MSHSSRSEIWVPSRQDVSPPDMKQARLKYYGVEEASPFIGSRRGINLESLSNEILIMIVKLLEPKKPWRNGYAPGIPRWDDDEFCRAGLLSLSVANRRLRLVVLPTLLKSLEIHSIQLLGFTGSPELVLLRHLIDYPSFSMHIRCLHLTIPIYCDHREYKYQRFRGDLHATDDEVCRVLQHVGSNLQVLELDFVDPSFDTTELEQGVAQHKVWFPKVTRLIIQEPNLSFLIPRCPNVGILETKSRVLCRFHRPQPAGIDQTIYREEARLFRERLKSKSQSLHTLKLLGVHSESRFVHMTKHMPYIRTLLIEWSPVTTMTDWLSLQDIATNLQRLPNLEELALPGWVRLSVGEYYEIQNETSGTWKRKAVNKTILDAAEVTFALLKQVDRLFFRWTGHYCATPVTREWVRAKRAHANAAKDEFDAYLWNDWGLALAYSTNL